MYQLSKKSCPEFFQNRAGRLSLGEDARPQYGCTDPDGTACGNMINTDWEVLYNMPLNEDNFLSECDLSAATSDCEKSDTYDLSVSYSEVNHLSFILKLFVILMTSTIDKVVCFFEPNFYWSF